MKIKGLVTALVFIILQGSIYGQNEDSLVIRKIYDIELADGSSYENLRVLCKDIGHRLSGSRSAQRAVEWGKSTMENMNFDTVFLQEVMVPHWVRGEKEVAHFQTNYFRNPMSVEVLALGGSIGTGPDGINANIIEVNQFEELEELGRDKIEGKIVFFNRPMEPKHIHTFNAYSGCVGQRTWGASKAAEFGAIGAVVRSVTHRLDHQPHTGAMRYVDTIPKIPVVAISTKGAESLSYALKKDSNLWFYLKTSCLSLADEPSFNVIGEIRGSEFPDEIIVVGGHLDSWDVGEGAHDDGAGVVQSMEAVDLLIRAGIKPKRTIRAVLYMNEENGLKGALKYAELAKENGEVHIAAIESDAGGFTPRGFGIRAEPHQVEEVEGYKPLLKGYGLHDIGPGWGGADIGTLKDHGTVLIGFIPDSQRYFDYHHSANDVFESVNKRELEMGAASISSLLYLLQKHGVAARKITPEGE